MTPDRVELARRAVQFSFADIIGLHVVARNIAPFDLDARYYGVFGVGGRFPQQPRKLPAHPQGSLLC
ncbi:hypothetical protein BN77_p2170006 [Rhizobium mesoamericanum STM3625]|uniref:Uncharacterized protein n=1 Tax=Rhizobium mesoamericanum STM3625 TaxID=1211777 RepID=K0Q6L8_9HYPH|nr:hypothetical protein BN77_p2170006 [Rhizobium mesoamericanum STM3625]